MSRIENTVFISYRRTNSYHALAIFQALIAKDYDVFIDYDGIDAGKFDEVILSQIKARAHFIVILTPSALERCTDPTDWVRREIETAIESERNIIPMLFEGFDWKNDIIAKLPDALKNMARYNALPVPSSLLYFPAAMDLLHHKFLNKPVDVVLHAPATGDSAVVLQKIEQANNQPAVTDAQLSAGEYFELGYQKHEAGDYRGAIADYTQALIQDPEDSLAWYNRGLGYYHLGIHPQAISDYTESIRLNPEYVNAHYNRGLARNKNGDPAGALADYNEALRRDPEYVNAYRARGIVYEENEEYHKARDDYRRYIALGGAEPEKIATWIEEVEEKMRGVH